MLYRKTIQPLAGWPIQTSWARELARVTSAMRPISRDGLLISRGTHGTAYSIEPPRVRPTIGENRPFDVRWCPHGYDGDGEWQIYLPYGCHFVTQYTREYGSESKAYILKNKKGRYEDGTESAEWYRIEEPPLELARVVEDRENRRIITISPVYINDKPYPITEVSGDPESNGRVAWQTIVAELIKIEFTDGGMTMRGANRLIDDGIIERTWDATNAFSIAYEMPEYPNISPIAEPIVYLQNQVKFLGRLQLVNDGFDDVTNWKDVWVKIDHSSETFKMSIEKNLTGDDARSDDDKTVYKIYSLADNVVTADLREQAPNLDFYTSPAKPNDIS